MRSVSKSRYCEVQLVNRIKSGDTTAFEEIYQRFHARLFNILLFIVKDRDQAKDLLQDSFIKVWLHLPHFNPDKARLFTWLCHITRNTAFDHLDRRKKMSESLEAVPLEKMGTVIPNYQHIDILYWINKALSQKQKKLIYLAYFQGYTQAEISNEFDIPLGTVKTGIRQALINLRAAIA